jgi:hypothetical protein
VDDTREWRSRPARVRVPHLRAGDGTHFVEEIVDGVALLEEVRLDLLGLLERGVGILIGHVGPLVGRSAEDVLPTMMTESMTSWMNVWLTH